MLQSFALRFLPLLLLGPRTSTQASVIGQRGSSGLHDAAKARGRYFGTAVDNPYLRQDATYAQYVNNTREFGQLVPENAMKWDQIQPRRGVFTFGNADEIAGIAAANNQLLRCHALLWHLSLPDWVTEGRFDNVTLISIMREHIHKEVSRYKGKCYSWDVVNEGKHRSCLTE